MRKWLKEKRESNKMTQKEVAESVGFSRQGYSQIEGGARRPSPEKAKKIAEVLDFDWTLFYKE